MREEKLKKFMLKNIKEKFQLFALETPEKLEIYEIC